MPSRRRECYPPSNASGNPDRISPAFGHGPVLTLRADFANVPPVTVGFLAIKRRADVEAGGSPQPVTE